MNISLKPVSVFLKKYKTLLPSVLIAFAALFLFVPIVLIGGSVKKGMESSFNMARQVQSELSDVPTRDKAQQVKYYMDKLQEDASAIEQFALQSCKRDLITYDDIIFPKPVDSSAQVFQEFGRKFRTLTEEMLKTVKALDAPSESEIRAKMGSNTLRTALGGRNPVQSAQAANQQDPVLEALCLSRAQEISVYAHPSAFVWYSFWEKYQFAGENQALQDCWDSQIAYWIYQDIIETIQKMNGTVSTVDKSVVKRLVGIRFSGPVTYEQDRTNMYMMMETMSMSSETGGRDIPNYITPVLFSNFLDYSPTGRVSNEDVDIVHFAVSVLVDNRFVLSFLKELCSEKSHRYRLDFSASGELVENGRHNQITVLQCETTVIDPLSPEHRLYRYGKCAVMQLNLVCEYQFYRKSYDMIKPQPIQQRLSLTQTTGSPSGSGMGL